MEKKNNRILNYLGNVGIAIILLSLITYPPVLVVYFVEMYNLIRSFKSGQQVAK